MYENLVKSGTTPDKSLSTFKRKIFPLFYEKPLVLYFCVGLTVNPLVCIELELSPSGKIYSLQGIRPIIKP